ncbi:MAG: hypothetical protein HYY07_02855, partial [Elusimicrobia bacterium]|nr:hypothetical protein [Elusimicrobiota bacterium]
MTTGRVFRSILENIGKLKIWFRSLPKPVQVLIVLGVSLSWQGIQTIWHGGAGQDSASLGGIYSGAAFVLAGMLAPISQEPKSFQSLIEDIRQTNLRGQSPNGMLHLSDYPKRYGPHAVYYLLRDMDHAGMTVQTINFRKIGVAADGSALKSKIMSPSMGVYFARVHETLNQTVFAPQDTLVQPEPHYQPVKMRPEIFYEAMRILESAVDAESGSLTGFTGWEGMLDLAESLGEKFGDSSVNLDLLYEYFDSEKVRPYLRDRLGIRTLGLGWKKISIPYARLKLICREIHEVSLKYPNHYTGDRGMMRAAYWLNQKGEKTHFRHLYFALGVADGISLINKLNRHLPPLPFDSLGWSHFEASYDEAEELVLRVLNDPDLTPEDIKTEMRKLLKKIAGSGENPEPGSTLKEIRNGEGNEDGKGELIETYRQKLTREVLDYYIRKYRELVLCHEDLNYRESTNLGELNIAGELWGTFSIQQEELVTAYFERGVASDGQPKPYVTHVIFERTGEEKPYIRMRNDAGELVFSAYGRIYNYDVGPLVEKYGHLKMENFPLNRNGGLHFNDTTSAQFGRHRDELATVYLERGVDPQGNLAAVPVRVVFKNGESVELRRVHNRFGDLVYSHVVTMNPDVRLRLEERFKESGPLDWSSPYS